jgi:hypothetical protein
MPLFLIRRFITALLQFGRLINDRESTVGNVRGNPGSYSTALSRDGQRRPDRFLVVMTTVSIDVIEAK